MRVQAVFLEQLRESIDLQFAHPLRDLTDLRLEQRTMVRGGHQLDEQGCAAPIRGEPPPGQQRLLRIERVGQAIDVRAGSSFEHRDEQIVECREVVVDQGRVDADAAATLRELTAA